MSARTTAARSDERLLTFEVAGALYAFPIAGVLEVAEPRHVACIPTLPIEVGGVINHHGDALPVVNGSFLFDAEDCERGELDEPGNVLVVTDRSTGAARLGVPVDRVLGLVDGPLASAAGPDVVAERRSIDGRVARVLDPKRLIAKAREAIENSLGRRD